MSARPKQPQRAAPLPDPGRSSPPPVSTGKGGVETAPARSWRGEAVVYGAAATQGSKRAFVNPKTGRAVVVEDNKRLRPWRSEMTAAMLANRPPEPPACAMAVAVFVYVKRPRSHYRTGKFAHLERCGMPLTPPTGKDCDKILRGCLDAGTAAGWWRDDRQVALIQVERRYCSPTEPEHVRVVGYTLL